MKIYDDIMKARNGHYVHALEVDSPDSLASIIETLAKEWDGKYTVEEATEFFDSMEIYYLNEEDPDCELVELEQSVHDFNLSDYYKEIMPCQE